MSFPSAVVVNNQQPTAAGAELVVVDRGGGLVPEARWQATWRCRLVATMLTERQIGRYAQRARGGGGRLLHRAKSDVRVGAPAEHNSLFRDSVFLDC